MFSLVETYEGKNNFLSATLDMLSLLNLGTGEQAKKNCQNEKKEQSRKEKIMSEQKRCH